MVLRLENLNDERIRQFMLNEVEMDIKEGKIYFSSRLKKESYETYISLLKESIQNGDDDSLANEIRSKNCLKSTETSRRRGGTITKRVPIDAHITLAEGEFNRFYLRAICLKAIEIGAEIEVYRAKTVRNPRPESKKIIGKRLDPNKFLKDLREKIGIETVLGLPKPNTGLSGKIKMKEN